MNVGSKKKFFPTWLHSYSAAIYEIMFLLLIWNISVHRVSLHILGMFHLILLFHHLFSKHFYFCFTQLFNSGNCLLITFSFKAIYLATDFFLFQGNIFLVSVSCVLLLRFLPPFVLEMYFYRSMTAPLQ